MFHKSFIYFYQHRLSIHVSKLYFYFNMSVYLLLLGNSTITNQFDSHQIYFEKEVILSNNWTNICASLQCSSEDSPLRNIFHEKVDFRWSRHHLICPGELELSRKVNSETVSSNLWIWSWWNFTSESRKFRRFRAIECRLSDQSQDCGGASAPAPPTPCSPCSGCTSRNPQVRHTWCKTWSLLMPSFGRRERIWSAPAFRRP